MAAHAALMLAAGQEGKEGKTGGNDVPRQGADKDGEKGEEKEKEEEEAKAAAGAAASAASAAPYPPRGSPGSVADAPAVPWAPPATTWGLLRRRHDAGTSTPAATATATAVLGAGAGGANVVPWLRDEEALLVETLLGAGESFSIARVRASGEWGSAGVGVLLERLRWSGRVGLWAAVGALLGCVRWIVAALAWCVQPLQ